MTSMFDYDDSLNSTFNAKTAGKNLVTAKHEVLSKTGDFLFLAHSDREFALRCQMVEGDVESAAVRKMANVSDSKAKLVRALHEEWKLRHSSCAMCKTAELIGNQDEIDANGNGEIEADDFKKLRAQAGRRFANDDDQESTEEVPDDESTEGDDSEYTASKTGSIVTAMGVRGVAYNPFGEEGIVSDIEHDSIRRQLEDSFRNGTYSKQTLANPDMYGQLAQRGGGRFYLERTQKKAKWFHTKGQKASLATRPEFNLFFSAGKTGGSLVETPRVGSEKDTFVGYSDKLKEHQADPSLHEPCNDTHVFGTQLSTNWKGLNAQQKAQNGGRDRWRPWLDRSKKFSATHAACKNHLVALSDNENKVLMDHFLKINPNFTAHPDHPDHQAAQDEIGTFVRDRSTRGGPVGFIAGHTPLSCGARQEDGTERGGGKVGFLPAGRSRRISGETLDTAGDNELKCVPGHTSLAHGDGSVGSYQGNSAGCGHSHPLVVSTSPAAGGSNRGRNIGGTYVEPNIGDPFPNRTMTITPLAPYETEKLDGHPKANLSNPSEAFRAQREIEDEHGYGVGEEGEGPARNQHDEEVDLGGFPGDHEEDPHLLGEW